MGHTAWQPRRIRFSHHSRYGLLFVSPALVYFAVFWMLPVLLAMVYSLTDWRIGQPARFIGVRNYARLLTDPQFHQAVRASLTITLVALAFIFVLSLGLALILNDSRLRFGRLFKLIIFLPVVTDWVATGLVWQLIFLPHQGVLAGVFNALDLRGWMGFRWTASRQLAPFAVALFTIWKMTGLYVVIYLAGLQSVPRHYEEAARVDGAAALQTFRYITMPLLRPITVFVLVSAFVVLIGLFEPIYMLTGGGPVDATRAMPIFLFEHFFQLHRAGYASGAAMIFLSICLGFALLAGRQLQHSFYD